jgi:hypothetical protein
MSIPVSRRDLASALRAQGPHAFVVTVGEHERPHVVHSEVGLSGDVLSATVGEHTALNAQARPRVSLLYPSRGADDYSLIVDADATVRATPDGFRLTMTPTRAVLHRPAPAPDPTRSSCGSDCVPLALPLPTTPSPP